MCQTRGFREKEEADLNLKEDDSDEHEQGADDLHGGDGELDERQLRVEPGHHPDAVIDAGDVRQEVVRVDGQHAGEPDRGHHEPRPAGPPAPRRELRQQPDNQEDRREDVHPGVDVLPPVARRRAGPRAGAEAVCAALARRRQLHHGCCALNLTLVERARVLMASLTEMECR